MTLALILGLVPAANAQVAEFLAFPGEYAAQRPQLTTAPSLPTRAPGLSTFSSPVPFVRGATAPSGPVPRTGVATPVPPRSGTGTATATAIAPRYPGLTSPVAAAMSWSSQPAPRGGGGAYDAGLFSRYYSGGGAYDAGLFSRYYSGGGAYDAGLFSRYYSGGGAYDAGLFSRYYSGGGAYDGGLFYGR